MISRQDILGWVAFAGAVLLITGVVGLFFPYQPLHLLYIGILTFFFGYVYHAAEVEDGKTELKQRRTHELKCWPPYFADIWHGIKKFEYRINDRGFRVGDVLWLREYNIGTKEYTGREVWVTVNYILCGFGVPEDHCIMSISEPWETEDGR